MRNSYIYRTAEIGARDGFSAKRCESLLELSLRTPNTCETHEHLVIFLGDVLLEADAILNLKSVQDGATGYLYVDDRILRCVKDGQLTAVPPNVPMRLSSEEANLLWDYALKAEAAFDELDLAHCSYPGLDGLVPDNAAVRVIPLCLSGRRHGMLIFTQTPPASYCRNHRSCSYAFAPSRQRCPFPYYGTPA